jgi:hypothetical protein
MKRIDVKEQHTFVYNIRWWRAPVSRRQHVPQVNIVERCK